MVYGPRGAAPGTLPDWRGRAACIGYPHDLFFPTGEAAEDQIAKAKEVCHTCPVMTECLEFAFETNQRSGIWGGTTEEERKALRRKWLTSRRQAS